jgi:PAS domain S-box-containing protein
MQWQLSPSVIAEAGTALGILIIAICFPWRDISRRARIIGSILLIIAALWILTHSLEIGIPVASDKASLMGLQLIWGLLALSLWLIYIIQYTATEKWQTRRIYTMFGIMPLLAILALVTNNIYGLMWTDPGLNINNPYLPLEPAYGLVYWVFMVYMAGLIIFGSFIVVKKVILQHNFRRWEPWILILVVIIPILAAFLEVTLGTLSTNLTIGLTPLISGLGIIALVWSLPRFHLQNVIPIARDTVFEQIGDCVVVLDMQNRVVDLNPAAEHLAGYTVSKALGLPVEQIWTNWPSQLEISKLASTVYLELVLTSAGEQKTYNLHIYTIVDGKSRPQNKVALLVDITESKQAQEEKKLLEAKAQVASRLAAVGEMAAGIAHEINNPLTGVLGFSQMILEKENIPEDIKENLKIIAGGSQRVADIVKRLLTFARQTKPIKTSVNLNEIIDNTLKLRDYVLKTANINVITKFDSKLPWVVVDPGQMQQVFVNLIVNAEQAMKKAHGKGTLTITTEKKENNIRLSFQDDGPGITMENRKKLFEPFFTTKDVGEGTGLGLSLSRSIILEHGGNLSVESEFGRGANFIIELPLPCSSPSEIEIVTPIVKVQSSEKKIGKILVVDDEPAVRILLEKVLTGIGYSLETIADAVIAMDKLDAGTIYDVILMDIRMPGMSGIELYTLSVRKMPSLKNKIIFITGDVMGLDIKTFLSQNNLPYLSKPFDIQLLKEKIDAVIKAGQV